LAYSQEYAITSRGVCRKIIVICVFVVRQFFPPTNNSGHDSRTEEFVVVATVTKFRRGHQESGVRLHHQTWQACRGAKVATTLDAKLQLNFDL
jgi:hypothetical protein